MRFFPVLLSFTTVLFHFGYQVLAPRITELLPELQPAEGFAGALKEYELFPSSNHNVGNEAGSSHGAIGDSRWQQGYTYGGHGYLGGASHDYPYSGHRGYQHDPYPQYGGNLAFHREQGSQHGSYQDAPRATFADVLKNAGGKADQRGQGAKPAKQRATSRANAVDGRGKQPVQAHQDRAAYGSQSYPLQSHDPTVAASQGGMRRMSGPRALKSPNGPLNGPQLALTNGWIVQLLKLQRPNTDLGEVMPSMRAYKFDHLNLPEEDSKNLLRFLQDGLIQQHARKWVELYRGLEKRGGVPTLATIEHPLALTNQVLEDAMLSKADRKSIYHSALEVHASYYLRAKIEPDLVKIEKKLVRITALNEACYGFAQTAGGILRKSWPDEKSHANAASLVVQFLNALDESKEGYNMFSAEEMAGLGDTTRKRRNGLEKKGSK